MGLSLRARASHRANVWYWRARYWWMDTEDGQQSRTALLCLSVLVVIIQLIKMFVAAALPMVSPDEPVKAIYWWVVQLIIAIVAAVAAYALAPKVEAPPAKQQDMPTVDDGQAVLEIHGDCWIDEEFIMAQMVVGKDPIKSEG